MKKETRNEIQKEFEEFIKGVPARMRTYKMFVWWMSKLENTYKAFGGCTECYGKGYSTEIIGYREKINTCVCSRGKDIETLMNKLKKKYES